MPPDTPPFRKRTLVQAAMDSYLPKKKRGKGRPKKSMNAKATVEKAAENIEALIR